MPVISLTPAHQLVIDGETQPVHLTRTEVRVLTGIFATSDVFTIDHFMSAYDSEDREDKLFNVYIYKVRNKLGAHRKAIRTEWGRGYMRHPDYTFIPGTPGRTLIEVPTKLLDQIALYDLTPPEALITKLLEKHLAAEKLRP